VYDEAIIQVPNAFSPNQDGINDRLTFQWQGIQDLKQLTIFDRYGKAVFSSRSMTQWWDGSTNGQPCPVGVYYYMAEALTQENKTIRQTGSITLLR
jgi:gliding motility-associated-like protein